MENVRRFSRLPQQAVIAYLVLVHVFISCLFLNTETMLKVKARLGISGADFQWNMKRYQSWMDSSVPDGAAIFIGDSHTQSLAAAAVAPNAVNFGVGSVSTTQLLNNLPTYKSMAHAGTIYLLIGTNDLLRGEQVGLAERLQLISDALPKQTPLVWSSIPPIDARRVAASDIEAANRSVEAVCKRRMNCRFVPTQPFLTGADGQLNPALFLEDRVHLNKGGYHAWTEALRRVGT